MIKIATVDKAKYNKLRLIIRTAMNATKSQEWSDDVDIQAVAVWQWQELEGIFQRLGPFMEVKGE